MSKNIVIIGTGYVGLVTGACFAKVGNTITFVDIDKEKIDMINKGVVPFYEPGLDNLLSSYRGKINATVDYKVIKDNDITFVCVGTPSKDDGSIDLIHVKQAVENIGGILKEINRWHHVVIKSTVLPGTTEKILLPILEKKSGKNATMDFGLSMNPEFLREGTAVYDFLNADRIVIGANDERSADELVNLYKSFSLKIFKTSITTAEMIKYASNAFLATKISFINEIGNMCKKLGIDAYEVADGMGLDKRIGRAFLDSGIGWGGSCFPKDLDALISWAKMIGEGHRIVSSVVEVNKRQPLKMIDLLKKHVPNLNGKTIGVLGLAFKPNTDDIRGSRAVPVVNQLLKEKAVVKAFDPKAMENFKKMFLQIKYCSSAEEALDSDAVLVLTKWEEFKKLDFTGKIVIDGRRLLEAKKTARIYEGVCW
ncbi:MAG: UDP-glucose 6-dehydrogenase [Thermoplasmata archaeon]|nr:MAG: UDP-glucose 6-dehydrogenase [Thermoplasmata archaeon]